MDEAFGLVLSCRKHGTSPTVEDGRTLETGPNGSSRFCACNLLAAANGHSSGIIQVLPRPFLLKTINFSTLQAIQRSFPPPFSNLCPHPSYKIPKNVFWKFEICKQAASLPFSGTIIS